MIIKIAEDKIRINVADIIGKCFGKLKVIKYAGREYSLTNGGKRLRHYYMCLCECGNMHLVQRGNLLNKHVRSCGCGRIK